MERINQGNQKESSVLAPEKDTGLRRWAQAATRITDPAFIILLKLGLISLVYFVILFFVVLIVRSL